MLLCTCHVRRKAFLSNDDYWYLIMFFDSRTTDNLNNSEEESDHTESQPHPPSSRLLPLTPEPTPQDPAPVESAHAELPPAGNLPPRPPARRRRSQQPAAGAQVDTRVIEYLRRAADEDGQDFFARGIVPLLRKFPRKRRRDGEEEEERDGHSSCGGDFADLHDRRVPEEEEGAYPAAIRTDCFLQSPR
ncbi:uncharacterized protein LOC142760754 isoform X1 [Rhinoderma darwinii]|uniref:uncharacterized protein LOC142760754 isoform X1 n=1 Tax=Rhinoderma darwinii TaxID=43563 RepID=UPI003F664D23